MFCFDERGIRVALSFRAVRLKCEYVQNVHTLGMRVNHDGLLAKRSCGSIRVRLSHRDDDPRLDQLCGGRMTFVEFLDKHADGIGALCFFALSIWYWRP